MEWGKCKAATDLSRQEQLKLKEVKTGLLMTCERVHSGCAPRLGGPRALLIEDKLDENIIKSRAESLMVLPSKDHLDTLFVKQELS